MKVQQELDETKIVLVRLPYFIVPPEASWGNWVDCGLYCMQHKTIESVLARGEKLNDLVDRSNALSAQSKMFYKTAKKVRLLLIIAFVVHTDTLSLFHCRAFTPAPLHTIRS